VAQGYSSADAVILATFLHGKTGDGLAKKSYIVTASEVAKQIPKTMVKLLQ
jgi:NAD(P)H-hydrate repair Nnr-like enzyme with NAD(P)H-hydrate dehydratase domain